MRRAEKGEAKTWYKDSQAVLGVHGFNQARYC